MKVLVTGGAGFIGSHVADALLEEDHTVHILDDLSSGHRRNVPEHADFFELDIRSDDAASLVVDQEYECIVHHAAQIDVRRSIEAPEFDASVNIEGMLNLMESGVQNGLRVILLASTGGAIYGEPEFTPQTLEHPLTPLSPYGVAKLASEKYLDYYRHQYGVRTVSLRYANVYGPRQRPHGEAGVVAIFTKQMLAGEQPVIYGDGTQTRDYVYVGDVVDANLSALNCDRSGVFNVGTGRETSVNTLFQMLCEETGVDLEEQHGPPKSGEQQRSVLGYAQTTETLNWTPSVHLEEGLSRTVNWFH